VSEVYKSLQNGPFFELDKRRQKAIVMLFEGNLNDEEIAKSVNRSRQTLNKWKNDSKFKLAQEQYKSLVVKKDFESKALRELVNLLNAKSEMVRLQTAITILKMSGMISDNSTPELDKAKIRKANAEADIAEYKAQILKDSGSSGVELLSEYLDKLDTLSDKEVKEDGTKADV
jgi:hypothetical protein